MSEQMEDQAPDDQSGDEGQEGWGSEEQARQLGWRPVDEFKGDPDKHIDADTFLERAQNDMPLLRSNNRRLQEQLEEQTKTIGEIKEYFDSAKQRAEEAGYQRAMQNLMAKQKKAIEDGDGDSFEKIERAKTQLTAQEQQKKSQAATQQETVKMLESFRSENEDLFTDFDKYEVFQKAAQFAAQNGKIGIDVLNEAKAVVARRFGGAQIPGPDDTSGNNGPRGARKHSFEDLPKDAKDQYFKFKKEFERTGQEFPKQEYLDNYQWD
jgi:hypothetical protein